MTEKIDNRSIYERLNAVMIEVTAVKKSDRNDHQKFNFRGIDAVVNAVGPALRKHGVIVQPEVQSHTYNVEQFGSNRTSMGHVQVLVKYTFRGLLGDALETVSAGEATDSGDKATAKAMSVAFRTALLQTLCLPTDEPDPDHFTYERSAEQDAPKPVKTASKAKKPTVVGDSYADFIDLFQNAPTASEVNDIRDSVKSHIDSDENKLDETQVAALRTIYADALKRVQEDK